MSYRAIVLLIVPLVCLGLAASVVNGVAGGPTAATNGPSPAFCSPQRIPPHAPASMSWLPHGYGGKMHIKNSPYWRMKGYQGFRTAPAHIGCWSQPLWGWDVNGFYRGPNKPEHDPAMCQLPIGLIYPENSIPAPRTNMIRKVR